MSDKQPLIFLNYRRALCKQEARLLYLMLDARFPGRVFQDENSLEAGDVWNPAIEQVLEKTKVLLVLIPCDWIYHPGNKDFIDKNPTKITQLSQLHFDENCNVRKEIEIALQKNITIIPLLINGATMPLKSQLPPSIQSMFDKYNAANQGNPLDFDKPNVDEFKKLFDQIAQKAGLTQQKQEDQENIFQPPVAQDFPLPDEIMDFLPENDAPFVGLKPFKRKHARLFFGRSREIYDLCFKILKQPKPRLLLLDGYSGTGKSSLLQAGLIPRVEAQGWAVAYRRREEDTIRGLKGVLDLLLKDVAESQTSNKLLILDQVEEAVTDKIDGLQNELEELAAALKTAITQHPNYKFILGFRSEQAARITKALSDEGLAVDKYTLYPLDRVGAIEAISGVARNPELNKQKYHLEFRPADLPEEIAVQLLRSSDNAFIAPLLQINMDLLWQRCKKEDQDAVVITGNQLQNLIKRQEELLDHYIRKVRENYPAGFADDQKILKILSFYVQDQPASAVRLDEEFFADKDFQTDSAAEPLLKELKHLYLLAGVDSGGKNATRLAHDVLAPIIHQRYKKLSEATLVERTEQLFNKQIETLRQQIYQLQYIEAQTTLIELFDLNTRREELRPWMLEMTFFWTETNYNQGEWAAFWIKKWIESNLLSDPLKTGAQQLQFPIDKAAVRRWLQNIDPGRYDDLLNKYYAPPGTVMVKVAGGQLEIGEDKEKRLAEVSAFQIANVQTTWWKYGLYLFATGQEKQLKDQAPSWGSNGDHPVVNVHWYDAVAYCNWLSEAQGLQPAYTIDKNTKDPNNKNKDDKIKWLVTRNPEANGYRLPTEVEWEYAARGGQKSQGFIYAGSNKVDEVAWYTENSNSKTHPVGELKPNELGLLDMSGNVWEWCGDWYADFPPALPKNYSGVEKGEYRVLRGGSWIFSVYGCRVAFRSRIVPDLRSINIGFRLVQDFF